jgi:ABC-type transporter Mla MlaB component
MLKITRQHDAVQDTLLLEGNLLKQWIEELQRAVEQARRDSATIGLDLSGLRFVDAEGAQFLRESRKRGVFLLNASPFVSALLDPTPQPRRGSRS